MIEQDFEEDRRHVERRHERKEIIKEALKEWLDEKVTAFGWWSIKGVSAAGLVALMYIILRANGWTIGK